MRPLVNRHSANFSCSFDCRLTNMNGKIYTKILSAIYQITDGAWFHRLRKNDKCSCISTEKFNAMRKHRHREQNYKYQPSDRFMDTGNIV